MTTPFPFVSGAVLTAAQLNAITTLPISAKTASYTLAVGDVGSRVQMTNAAATTITINTGIFSAGDTIWIQNMGAGTCTITAGTATVTTASSLALAQYGGGTLVFQSASAATFFSQQAATYGTATGGSSSSITVGGVNYTLLTFTSDGTLTITKAGLFDVLMFGGGSAAYRYDAGAHAGGAGGGILQQTVYLSDATYTVDIGAGGAAGASLVAQQSGLATSLGSIPVAVSAIGGFMRYAQSQDQSLGLFGSQTGCIGNTSSGGINNIQGYKGGNSVNTTSAGGGGGSGGVGGNGSGTTGGAGGLGTEVNTFIGGSSLFKASGGGGGGSVTGGAAGSGLGNAGTTSTGNTPAANTAAGGGGGNGANTTGSGASGILYVRFKV